LKRINFLVGLLDSRSEITHLCSHNQMGLSFASLWAGRILSPVAAQNETQINFIWFYKLLVSVFPFLRQDHHQIADTKGCGAIPPNYVPCIP